MARTYLDYNATSPLMPSVLEAMNVVLGTPSNASSMHTEGRQAHAWLENARNGIAEVIGAFPREIIFTASATEANNWALTAFSGRRVITSAIEHPSVLQAASATIPVDEAGVIKLDGLDALLRESGDAIVSVMLANNETGVIQPLANVAELCRVHGALLHCDAVQAVGRIPLELAALGVDMLTLSAHKSGGPMGAAALIVRGRLEIPALLKGGGQELRRRSGTENVAAIVGMAHAMEMPLISHVAAWRDKMESMLPGVKIMGAHAPRLPNTSCMVMPGVNAETQLMHFDLNGIAISAGSACSSGRIGPSHVLAAMGALPQEAECAIRVSMGWNTVEADIDRVAKTWQALQARVGNHD